MKLIKLVTSCVILWLAYFIMMIRIWSDFANTRAATNRATDVLVQ